MEQSQFNTFYQSLDSRGRSAVDGLITSANNFQASNKLSGEEQLEFIQTIYNNAQALAGSLRDNTSYSVPASLVSGSSNRGQALANEVTRRYVSLNKTGLTTKQTQSRGHYTHNWDDYFDTGYQIPNQDFRARLLQFATNMQNGVSNVVSNANAGKGIHGIASGSLSTYQQAANDLNDLITKINNGDYDANKMAGIDAASKLAQKLKVSSSIFQDYFSEYFPTSGNGVTEVTDLDQSIKNLLQSKGYKVGKDSNDKIGIYNADLSQLQKGIRELTQDQQSVILADEDGNAYIGKLDDSFLNHPLHDYWVRSTAGYKDLFKDINWNYDSNYSDNPAYQAFAEKIGKSFGATDISPLIYGDDTIFARTADGSPAYTTDSKTGLIQLNPNAQYYKVDSDGNIKELNYNSDIRPMFRQAGWDENYQFGTVSKIKDALSQVEYHNIDTSADLGGRSYADTWTLKNWKDYFKNYFGFHTGPLVKSIRYAFWDNISEDPEAFAKNLLNGVATNWTGKTAVNLEGVTDNQELLKNLDFRNKQLDYTEFLEILFRNNPGIKQSVLSNSKLSNAWNKLRREYNQSKYQASKKKFGGSIDINSIRERVNINKQPKVVKEESKQEEPKQPSKDRFGDYLKAHK